MEKLTLRAYAKINLTLDITGRRQDGYHLLRTVMQSIDLYDTLTFTRREEENTEILIRGEAGEEIPAGEDNLIAKAVRVMRTAYGFSGGLLVELTKRIPTQAGLGGGSADAAATMKAVNKLFALGLSGEELEKTGVQVGADVPFLLRGGTVLCEGIGEILTTLPDAPACGLLVAKPSGAASTAEIYRAYDEETEPVHPDVEGMLQAIHDGDFSGMAARCANVLQPVTEKKLPQIRELRETFLSMGATASCMTGSGSAIFSVFPGTEQAKMCYANIELQKKQKGQFEQVSLYETAMIRPE